MVDWNESRRLGRAPAMIAFVTEICSQTLLLRLQQRYFNHHPFFLHTQKKDRVNRTTHTTPRVRKPTSMDNNNLMSESAEHEPYPLHDPLRHVVSSSAAAAVCSVFCLCPSSSSSPSPHLTTACTRIGRRAATTNSRPRSWGRAAWSGRAASASSVSVWSRRVSDGFKEGIRLSTDLSYPPGLTTRHDTTRHAVEEQYEEEQVIAGSPPKMLPPPFPMNPAGTALNNPPVHGNEQQGRGEQGPTAGKAAPPMPEQQQQQQQQGQEGKVGSE